MSFLDPYSKNRRLPLLLLARLGLIALVAGVAAVIWLLLVR
ncbi:MAG: hypothetical protein ACT4PU_03795 [Planctomycetota bacterium]